MENSQSQQASTNPSVSTSHVRKVYTNDDVVQIRPTTRKGDVWSNYDLCVMIDGVEKARCKKCMKFYNPGSNSTLRTHKSGCNAVSQNDTSQGTIGADGQVFIFDNDAVRLDFTKFVIQQALPFNHFDNVKLTEIIKRRLQPRYQHHHERSVGSEGGVAQARHRGEVRGCGLRGDTGLIIAIAIESNSLGAGICGLATTLALHRKGIKSLVFEKSDSLRNITGAAIGIWQNGELLNNLVSRTPFAARLP
ncbi:zinc finger, BED-type, phospholipase-like, homeodomain-like protein [Tanacetum coccineum]